MSEDIDRPRLPGYVTIKEAAKILNLSDKRVYEYVEDGRLSSVWASHVIMIPLDEVQNFKPNISGRPRKSVPLWHISPDDNLLLSTLILVRMKSGQQNTLMQKLEEIRQTKQHLFPGTIGRYFIGDGTGIEPVQILLIWRSSVVPDVATREQNLQAFREALDEVLDWGTAEYHHGRVFMHT